MQPGSPVTLPPTATSSPLAIRPQPGPTGFGDELIKQLAAIFPSGATDNIEPPTTGLPQSTAASASGVSADTMAAELRQPLALPSTASGAAASDPSAAGADPAPEPQPASPAAGLDAAIQLLPPMATISAATETSTPIGVVAVRPRSTTGSRRDGDTLGTATTTEAMPPVAVVPAVPPPAADPSELVCPPPPDAIAAALKDATDAPAHSAAVVTARPLASPEGAPHADTPSNTRQPAATQGTDTSPVLPPVQASALAAPTPAQPPSATAAAPGTPHTSPATQIAPALVSLSHAPDGAQRLTMKLEPPELGQVQIRIDRPADNTPARIAITVERPETLQLLLRDQPQLQRALDQAGVPAEGRSISFHIASPEPAARNETAVAPAPTGSSSAMGGDFSYGASRQGGQSAQSETQQSTTDITDDIETVEAIPIMPMRWLRAGLDITA